MWVSNVGTKRYSKTEKINYLKFNFDRGNPAIRISEKARKELGWEAGDLVRVYVDGEKIMIVKEENGDFPIRGHKSNEKNYGFTIFGQALKDAIQSKKWEMKVAYPLEVIKRKESNDFMIICFKDEAETETDDLVRRQIIKKYSVIS